MKDLIIIGAGGFGREVAWITEKANKQKETWNLLGFLDDDLSIQGSVINDVPVLGPIDRASQYQTACYLFAIGHTDFRRKLVDRVISILGQVRFATLIDPTADVSRFVEIGEGSIVCAHAVITTNVIIGKHTIITSNCNIGHDDHLGDFVTIFPGANLSGMVQIGDGSQVGTGAQVIQGKSIGDHSIIGAGATVISDIPDHCVAVGCPCKPIKSRVVS